MPVKTFAEARAEAGRLQAIHYRDAALLIEAGGLVQYGFAEDEDGEIRYWSDPRAVSFCTTGALERAAWDEDTLRAEVDAVMAEGCTMYEAAESVACESEAGDWLFLVADVFRIHANGPAELDEAVARWNDWPGRTAADAAAMLRECARRSEVPE